MAKPKLRTFKSIEEEEQLKEQFLEHYATTNNMVDSAKRLGISMRQFDTWRKEDPEFDAAVDETKENNMLELEASVYGRAMRGDTTLSIFLMKAWRPEKYRDMWRGEIGPAAGGGAIKVKFVAPSDDEKE